MQNGIEKDEDKPLQLVFGFHSNEAFLDVFPLP